MDDPVLRLQRGERGAFREIVEAHQARLRAFVAAFGLPPADVDDVAQDAFLFAYEHIREFEAGTRLGAWLKAIARNKAMARVDALRREARNKGNYLRQALLEPAAGAEAPDAAEAAERLKKCVRRLPEAQRSLLERRYEGVPLNQFARELGRSVDAVKMLLLRIRKLVRKCVETGAAEG
jgi:RNA polymerase sigma-70 factor (ECF subfamily)